MTLQKWIEDRAIHGFPTFSVEDVSRFNISNYTDTDEKELAYFPATLPSDNGSAGTTETSCGDLD